MKLIKVVRNLQIANVVIDGSGIHGLHLHFRNIILVTLIAIAIGIALVGGFCVFAKFFTGWTNLTRRFPVMDVHGLGKIYAWQNGYFTRKFMNRPLCLFGLFSVELAQEGLLVTAYFARCSLILIPWSEIQNVEIKDMTIQITVHYERDESETAKFTIPTEVLTVIQQNVPAERLHKATSFSELINNR